MLIFVLNLAGLRSEWHIPKNIIFPLRDTQFATSGPQTINIDEIEYILNLLSWKLNIW